MIQPYLQFFNRIEFINEHGDWWPEMSPRLLVMLDVLRFMGGQVIWVSANAFALGRHLGPIKESEHNIDFWDACLAADVFIDGVYTQEQAERYVKLATDIGFTGIGVYTDTVNNAGEPQVMFHFGVRSTEKMGDPATWGRVNDEYVTLQEALDDLE